ncbi:CDP-diacylglycerol--glycerol-3-phosphate 3-phosphatidyltransferase [bacterium]|nr:MAG: CDP-diacylglycerol--glycerol-3-phosphate 3-phosphatidyltransferase [bacterium]
MNFPNALTVVRIILAPLVFLSLNNGGIWLKVGLGLFLVGALTDWLDGFFARRHKVVTGFGQFADPVADKLLSGFALAAVAATGFTDIWPVIGIIVRDVVVTSFRFWGLNRGRRILPSRMAKAKTIFELVSLIGIISYIAFGGRVEGFWLGTASLIVVFALAWITGIDYFWKNRELLSGAKSQQIDDRPDRQL